MALVSKDPDYWKYHNIPVEPKDFDTLYRILHLRDAVFLDDMYFRGRKAAEDYLHKHMYEMASYVGQLRKAVAPSYTDKIVSCRIQSVIDDNRIHLFEIVEV